MRAGVPRAVLLQMGLAVRRILSRSIRAACNGIGVLVAVLYGTAAHSAEGAFAVDNADVNPPGFCKVETWGAAARNGDRVFAVAPLCAVSLGQPVDLAIQVDRANFDGEWVTSGALKAKTSIIPLNDTSRFGIAISGAAVASLRTNQFVAYTVNVPVTFRVTDSLDINVQVGGLWDRIDNRSHVTWGGGFEYTISPQLMLIGEVFGLASEHRGAQAGLRFTPHEKIDFDLIYGHNLAGEKSDWITLGMNVRF
jgi:hypothetical protein